MLSVSHDSIKTSPFCAMEVGTLAARLHRQLFLQLHHVMDEAFFLRFLGKFDEADLNSTGNSTFYLLEIFAIFDPKFANPVFANPF